MINDEFVVAIVYAKLSTAKSANMYCKNCPHHEPRFASLAKNSFYTFGKKTFYGCQQSAHKYYSLVGLELCLALGSVLVYCVGLGYIVLRLGSV